MRSFVKVVAVSGLLGAGFAPPASAAVTTFSNSQAITIVDDAAASPYPTEISTSGLAGTVLDANVTLLGYSHTCPNDVSALLVSPSGARTVLMADLGQGLGCPASTNADLTFDDAASQDVPYPPVTGIYRPTDGDTADPDTFPPPAPSEASHPLTLSALNGGSPNGAWRLYVRDEAGGDTGSFAGGWSLTLTTPDPPDTDPPETTITKDAPKETTKSKVKFRFVSDEAASTFECKTDKKPFKPCTSPKTVKRLDEGKHKFKVRAIDAAGNADPTVAKDKFKVI